MSPKTRAADVTILTPHLPWRAEMLEECKASANAQTILPVAHLVEPDPDCTGFAATLNRLWPRASTKWVTVLADDDLLDPDFLETLLNAEEENPDCDIYYVWCRTEGRGNHNPNRPWDGGINFPANGLFSLKMVRELDGWRSNPRGPDTELHSDTDFLARAQAFGAKFCCVEQVKWTQRFHGHNLSMMESVR